MAFHLDVASFGGSLDEIQMERNNKEENPCNVPIEKLSGN